jgi:hypothetical protein
MDGQDDSTVSAFIRESGLSDRFVETRYLDETAMPTPLPEEIQRGYILYGRHWMDLVFPNSVPNRDEVTGALEVFASRGEYEPVTFCIRTLRDLQGLEVRLTELISDQGARLAPPDVRIVRCVPRIFPEWEPLYEGGPMGVMNMPTYLEPTRPVDVAAKRAVQFWLAVHVGSDAEAGTYNGTIEIAQQGGETHTLPLTVEVLPIRLDEPASTLGFWDFNSYKGEIGSVAEVYKIMRRYGMNAVSMNGADLSHWDDQRKKFDYSDHLSVEEGGRIRVSLAGSSLEERMEAAKQAGFETVIYTPGWGYRGGFVGQAVRRLVDRETLERESAEELERLIERYAWSEHRDRIEKEIRAAAEEYFPAFSESFAAAYVQVLQDILEEGRRRGWPRILVDPTDERISHYRRGNSTCLAMAVRDLELMKRAGATTILNLIFPTLKSPFREYGRELLRNTDVAMPPPRLSEEFVGAYGERGPMKEIVEGFADLGIATYNYNLTIYGMPDLGAARFNSGFFFETLGAGVEGEFDYVFFRLEGDPYNPLDGEHQGHEFMWYFPPHEPSDRLGGPSLWLEAKREGVDDLRYLQTLNRLIEEASATDASPVVRKAAAKAQATRDRLLGSFDFSHLLRDPKGSFPRGKWDAVTTGPGVEPTVQGSCRPPAGWSFESFDRGRREIANAIIMLERASSD